MEMFEETLHEMFSVLARAWESNVSRTALSSHLPCSSRAGQSALHPMWGRQQWELTMGKGDIFPYPGKPQAALWGQLDQACVIQG